MMLSPQAPPPAYIAVFFQGLLGELLFWNRKYFRLMCVLLGILAMLESSFQRIFSLTILYGNDLWTAVNTFITKFNGTNRPTDYSYFILFWYVLLHLVVGVLLGLWISFLPQRINNMSHFQIQYDVRSDTGEIVLPQPRRKKKMRLGLFITWIILIGLYIQSFFKIRRPLLPSAMALLILVRSV